LDYKKFNGKILLRLDKGDEITESVSKVCTENNVKFASIDGIGACGSATLGYYEPDTKVFTKKVFDKGDYEIISLIGNFSLCDGKPYVHMHISISGSDYRVFGGHLISAVISITGEILLTPVGDVSKKYDSNVRAEIIDF
jgi:hypothetical protein